MTTQQSQYIRHLKSVKKNKKYKHTRREKMKFMAEKDKLKDFTMRDQLFGSFGKGEAKCIMCEYNILNKEAVFVVYNQQKEILKVSDLDIAIDKFNKI